MRQVSMKRSSTSTKRTNAGVQFYLDEQGREQTVAMLLPRERKKCVHEWRPRVHRGDYGCAWGRRWRETCARCGACRS